MNESFKIEDFDFTLPPSAIASFPAEPRDSARLMVIDRQSAKTSDQVFSDLKTFLKPGDCLVLNNSRVIPARLFGHQNGRRFEIFLLSPLNDDTWECLVRPGKKIKGEVQVEFSGNVTARICRQEKNFTAQFSLAGSSFMRWLETAGEVPLPPYLNRAATLSDKNDYQTVFAEAPGSVAAPTAGLHFSEEGLKELKALGIRLAWVTLHVGYGTFAPLDAQTLSGNELHAEGYEMPEKTAALLAQTRQEGGRIYPVGTTSLRVIESFKPGQVCGSTRLFIKPGYRFRWADGLITNFHLPRSSLFVLVTALLGVGETRRLYESAVEKGYRFYRYGDAMLIR